MLQKSQNNFVVTAESDWNALTDTEKEPWITMHHQQQEKLDEKAREANVELKKQENMMKRSVTSQPLTKFLRQFATDEQAKYATTSDVINAGNC